MDNQVEETVSYQELRAKAKALGINGHNMKTEDLEKAIDAKKNEEGPTGITAKDAVDIRSRMEYEEKVRDEIRHSRDLETQRTTLVAESEALNIPIVIPEDFTELDLARARHKLGMKKKEVKPSPETVQIEASKRGYYRFRNLEQKDANHTAALGGKYIIHLIAKQVHVLSEYHVRRWGQICITPTYERVPTGVVPGENTTGQAVEQCMRTGGEQRWTFEHLGEAPQNAEFGLVTDPKILKELTA